MTESTVNKCEFCNEAESTHEIVSINDSDERGSEVEISVLACGPCLHEIQLGHVLRDVYGRSWTKFEGEYIAEYVEPEPKEVADVPF